MSAKTYQHIGVIGAGAWGAALAIVAARAGREVVLCARDADAARKLNAARKNPPLLPGIEIPAAIRIEDAAAGLGGIDAVFLAVPAQQVRAVSLSLKALPANVPVVICAKGIEQGTLKLMPEILAETLPNNPAAILSGPNFAADIARGLPSTTTIAAHVPAVAQGLQQAIATRTFRPYASDDVTGVAVGGAIKNVLAIACGIAIGLGFGENARAAIVTRGFAEMVRLCKALGGRQETLMGLAGLGDLFLTASSPTSRNYMLGVQLGQGIGVADLLAASGKTVTEGIFTAAAAVSLAGRHQIEMPVTAAVASVLEARDTIADAINRLLDRPLRSE